MALTYRYVPRSHYVPAWHRGHPELGRVRDDLPKALERAPRAIVVTDGNGLVGFLRFWMGRGRMHAGGTWVDPTHRGKGIAVELWRRVLERHDPSRVSVNTISRGGRALVAALVRDWPGVAWEINAS